MITKRGKRVRAVAIALGIILAWQIAANLWWVGIDAPTVPLRSIRVDADLWQLALEKARNEGTTATAIIIQALREYIK